MSKSREEQTVEEQSDILMKLAAQYIMEDLVKEFDEIEPVEVPSQLNKKIKSIFSNLRRKKHMSRLRKYAAVSAMIGILFLISSTMMKTQVEAFWQTLHSILFEETTHSDDLNFIQISPHANFPESWNDIWYPKSLPKDFILHSAETVGKDIKQLTFQDAKGNFIVLSQCPADGSRVSADNEINDNHTGTLYIHENIAYWHKKMVVLN